MRLVVVSHKQCWRAGASPSGFASSGGFPFQMRALAELFDRTTIAVPIGEPSAAGEIPLSGRGLHIVPLTVPRGSERWRKLWFPWWFVQNLRRLVGAIAAADAVHTPIPGDIGTIGIALAVVLRKPLFVRYCGNWFVQRTAAEHFWRWFMERAAGGRNVMMATGGAPEPPSHRNRAVRWIYSTTLTESELTQVGGRSPATRRPGARLIIVCRQEGGKGTEVLIDSLPLVLRHFPAAQLDIVGDGFALPQLRARAEDRAVADRVMFHGAVDHDAVLELLRAADLFCYPTASEGFPKVVLEALASGLPVVTTPVSVLPQLVDGCGVLLDPVNAATLADAICALLDDPARYQAMSRRAVERARAYSLESWRDAIGDVLRNAWGPLQAHA